MPNDSFEIDEREEFESFLKLRPSGTKLKERFIDKYGVIVTIIIFVFFAAICPILFTQSFDGFAKFSDTGQIGDTIGGLTAPIIGILNALLLWWTLRKQGQQIYEQNLQDRIHRQIDKLERDLANQSITFSSPSTDQPDVTYKGKVFLFRMMDFFSMQPPPFKNDVINPMEWKVVRHQLLDIISLANRIALLNLQSKTSFEDKVSIYYEIKGRIAERVSLLPRLIKILLNRNRSKNR